ncbi:MAG: hypothetical protein HC924_16675 [Synechococcaceae cyanobacterium SM2_3_2]|nr:hypothetical protein [Synechococcaceae cyanobacterium SM2_3_2]
MQTPRLDREKKVAEIVRDAGGSIVGRTKFQKVAYLLELAGFGNGFRFEYRHYGPYSEDLTSAISTARVFGLIREEEKKANWGGIYSVYTYKESDDLSDDLADSSRKNFAQAACQIDSILLELAATAAYLYAVEGSQDPWGETAQRKPTKAKDGRLELAKNAYRNLLDLSTPKPLPKIA